MAAIAVVAAADDSWPWTKKCRALTMSGGGSFGAYEAGVLYGLVENANNEKDFQWDVMSGVSAGSINSVAGALWKKGSESDMVQWLSDTWANVTTNEVFDNWQPNGVVTGIFTKSGVFNDTPGFEWGTKIVESAGGVAHRMFEAACVNANNGQYTTFNETVPLVKAAISSSSIPAAFPYTKWSDYDGRDVICIDGGSVWNVNVPSAIDRCRNEGFEDENIIVDIVLCNAAQAVGFDWEDRDNSVANLEHYKRIKKRTTNMNNIAEFMSAYPKVDFRYLIMPQEEMPGGLSWMIFDNDTVTWDVQMIGRKDGARAVKQGPGAVFNRIREWLYDGAIQASHPNLERYALEFLHGN